MKKLIYLFLTVLIVACSGEDNNEGNNDNDDNNESNLLVSSINYSRLTSSGTRLREETFTYNGNKIIERTTQTEIDGNPVQDYYSGRTEYFYANNKISRTYYYYNDTNLRRQKEFLYDPQGRVVSIEQCFEPNDDGCDELVIESFSYNDDGSITSTGTTDGTIVYQLDNNGNIISITDDDGFFALIYDNQKNPFKNLTGASNILYGSFSNAYFISYTNNCLSFVYTSTDGYVDTVNWTYDYNDAGYPRNVFTDGSEEPQTIAIEYFE